MGHIALIQTTVTFYDLDFSGEAREAIEQLRADIEAYGNRELEQWDDPPEKEIYSALLIGPVTSAANDYIFVTLLPDGSKSGWETHGAFIEWRERLEEIAETYRGDCTHVVIGGANEEPHVITDDIYDYS